MFHWAMNLDGRGGTDIAVSDAKRLAALEETIGRSAPNPTPNPYETPPDAVPVVRREVEVQAARSDGVRGTAPRRRRGHDPHLPFTGIGASITGSSPW